MTRFFDNDYFHHGMMDGDYFKYGNWNSGWYMLIALAAVVLIVTVILIIHFSRKNKRKSTQAIEILKNKYALGEITDEEYHKRKSVLEEK